MRFFPGLASLVIAFTGLAASSSAASAGQAPPDYGMTWSTIGAPGNRLPNAQEAPAWFQGANPPGFRWGRVDYSYRLTKTEVTAGVYLEFVRAYLRANPPGPVGPDTGLSGGLIQVIFGQATLPNAFREFPATMSWEFAARYCNWLHNDKATSREAFERGVYDTSTFRYENDVPLHQTTPAPGAKYWIPSVDEWYKGAYYDPNKNNGLGGYWMYPGMQDTPLISGLPSAGGQTSAQTFADLAVGSYPGVVSPWGLLDVSGSEREWSGTIGERNSASHVFILGTASLGSATIDRLESGPITGLFGSPSYGLRIASSVPAPGVGVVCAPLLFAVHRRKRAHGAPRPPARAPSVSERAQAGPKP